MLMSNQGICARQVRSSSVAYDQYDLRTCKYGDGYNSYFSWLQVGNGYCGGLFGGGGSTTNPVTSAIAGKHWEFVGETTATSGDNRLFYLRYYLTGDGSTTGGGECLRVFTTVNDAAVGTAHGAHISLSFGSTGTLTGLGVAMRATLHLPNASPVGGTLAAGQIEVWSDGASSDPAGSLLSFLRFVNGGNATGVANVDDDAFLFELSGFTAGSGHLFDSTINTAGPQIDHTIKIKTPAGTGYIPVMDNADGS